MTAQDPALDIDPKILAARAEELWEYCIQNDARLATLISACRSGTLSAEQMAEGMWCLGFINGAAGMMGAVNEAVRKERTENDH